MYGLRTIVLALAAAASFVQGAEQGSYLQPAFSGSASSSAVNAVAPVTAAPTTTQAPGSSEFTSAFSSVMARIHNRDPHSKPTTALVEPLVRNLFNAIISRLKELERKVTDLAEHAAATVPFLPAATTTTTTKPWDISIAAVETGDTDWLSRPTFPVRAAAVVPTAESEPASTFVNAGRMVVSSTVANSTNQTATTSATSGPTSVPPAVGGVAKTAAPAMGAVVVFVAGFVLVL